MSKEAIGKAIKDGVKEGLKFTKKNLEGIIVCSALIAGVLISNERSELRERLEGKEANNQNKNRDDAFKDISIEENGDHPDASNEAIAQLNLDLTQYLEGVRGRCDYFIGYQLIPRWVEGSHKNSLENTIFDIAITDERSTTNKENGDSLVLTAFNIYTEGDITGGFSIEQRCSNKGQVDDLDLTKEIDVSEAMRNQVIFKLIAEKSAE